MPQINAKPTCLVPQAKIISKITRPFISHALGKRGHLIQHQPNTHRIWRVATLAVAGCYACCYIPALIILKTLSLLLVVKIRFAPPVFFGAIPPSPLSSGGMAPKRRASLLFSLVNPFCITQSDAKMQSKKSKEPLTRCILFAKGGSLPPPCNPR